ncbi:hypothetical protein SY88_06535 [Clostridiales bacterium PH28_bin88]|nr:hypothetical protein SY88_06535 [Clostridiales bacterium PH28_bin88]
MAEIKIRPVHPDDVEAINEMRRKPSVIDFTMSMPSERVADNRKFVESLGTDDHVMVAEVDGRVAGVGGLHVMSGKRRHVGNIGIMVGDEFQGQGIGKTIMKELLDLADSYLGLIRVELEVWADNNRAIHLYERFGFVIEGCKRKSVYRRGTYSDVLIMSRIK